MQAHASSLPPPGDSACIADNVEFSCHGCGRTYQQPIFARISSRGNVQSYHACPHCMTRVPESNIKKGEHRTSVSNAPHNTAKDPTPEVGCKHFFGYLNQRHAHNYYPDFLWKNGQKVPLKNIVRHPEKHYKPGQENLVGLASEKVDYSHDLFTDAALDFIKQQNRPFFLFLPYTIPHANNEAKQFGEHGMEVPDYGIYRDKDWLEPEKGKAAMISRLDRDIGRILAQLKASGIDEQTLVIFSSDNGPHKEGGVKPDFFDSNGPLKGIKRDLYEGGIRVPTIARWPGRIKAGRRCEHISAFWDILPTFAELAGVPVPEGIDGISMVPALLGKRQNQHEFLYWEFHEGSSKQAVRMGDWKAVRLAPSRPIELYNLTSDIGEQNNIADTHPDLVARAKDIFDKIRTDTRKKIS